MRVAPVSTMSNQKVDMTGRTTCPFEHMQTGAKVPAHEGHSVDTPPPWVDHEKLRKGQQFVQKYYTSIMMSHYFSALLTFVWEPIYKLMTYTANMATVRKAFQRSVDSVRMISSWYEGDMWDPKSDSYQNMKKVQAMHHRVAIIADRNKERVAAASVDTKEHPALMSRCTMWECMKQDAIHCESLSPTNYTKYHVDQDTCFISQLDSAAVVLGAIGPLVVYRERFGVHGSTDEELEDFLHLWRIIGYHIGIKDEYNPCAQGLEHFCYLYDKFISMTIYPTLANITAEEEYTSRVLVMATRSFSPLAYFSGISFESIMMYGLWCLGLDLPSVQKQVRWYQRVKFHVLKFIVTYVLSYSVIYKLFNVIFKLEIYRLTRMRTKMVD